MIYWLGLMFLTVTFALIIYNGFPIIIEHWQFAVTTIISLFGILVTLKDVSERFQKFLYKTKVILRNRQIAWSLDGKYSGEAISVFTFTTIKKFLKELGENNILIYENTSDISLSVDGIILQCAFREQINDNIYSNSDTIGAISFYIPEYHAPYVEANALLDQRIMPILNEIKQEVGECDESFTFDVFFKEYHPYLGLYLKGRNNSRNISFHCSFIEAPSTKGLKDESVVTISKKKLSLNTKTFTPWIV